MPGFRYIRWFSEVSLPDTPLVGGKNASLGELYQNLVPRGIRVPNGFAVTAEGYRHFLKETEIEGEIQEILKGLDVERIDDLRERGRKLRQTILAAEFPQSLEEEIVEAYRRLSEAASGGVDVAVRSSATAEDLPEASFAGQQETFLNVRGESPLLDACRRCFASLFTDRAISYRAHHGFSGLEVALSIGVQRMVRSDLAGAGVMFSIDTETGFRDAVLINAAYGLGESVVQGSVVPDEYVVFKPTLKEGFCPILRKTAGTKEFKLVYAEGGTKGTRSLPVPAAERAKLVLLDDEILELARWASLVEEHYSGKRGRWTPMDLEWAKDGRTGELFIVQARPETVQSRKALDSIEQFHLTGQGPVLVTGRSVGERIAAGAVRIVSSPNELSSFQAGEVLVAARTDPDWEPVMKKAAAIVTDHGGRTCHAAIVSRELGLPAVVGTSEATRMLRNGQKVTVSCAEGETGKVYEGILPFERKTVSLAGFPRPKTRVMMNVGNPSEAFRLSFLPNDGVGLARMEFIITNHIGIHPLALLHYEQLEDKEAKERIGALTAGYEDKPAFFVDRLAEGIGTIAAAFHPKDVIVRLSDFKTNEYARLLGGAPYEPLEENPMLGFRGASRYYHPRYQEGFALECRALQKVRDGMGLRNVKVMVPFCRTVEEGRRVVAEMERHGLRRGESGLELYVMCEIPSNVVLAEEFAEVFDGFSIGSNDLTQLVLGVDRDSEIVAPLFDERNPAVKRLVAQVIGATRKCGRKIGICGQAPSDYPEFLQFLVQAGIDSISLNPDVVLRNWENVARAERELSGNPPNSPGGHSRLPPLA